jgi:Acetyltransferases, including N-acetylases of ribosomal proteins
MTAQPIRTRRLDLVPATGEILSADLSDHRRLSRLLEAEVPAAWPPAEMNREVLSEFYRMETEKTDPLFACWYWVLDEPGAAGRVLVGSGGTGSAISDPETVLIGYSVLDMFQNRGYATEAVQGMIPAIFSHSRISRIMATTFPELKSIHPGSRKDRVICTGRHGLGTGSKRERSGSCLEPGSV